MYFAKLESVEQVKKILNQIAEERPAGIEVLPLKDCLDRICAGHIYAERPIPEFNRSIVDGYAVLCRDIVGASEAVPVRLRCNGEVSIGAIPDIAISPGETVYVPTGAKIPDGADGMVMVEDCTKIDEHTVLVGKPVVAGENISCIGDDLQKDEVAIAEGTNISPYHIGLLAGLGISELPVRVKPRLSIISTGDEIVDIKESPMPGQIFDMNGYAIAAASRRAGAEPVFRSVVKDDAELLCRELNYASGISDIVVLSGGSSVGSRDFSRNAVESMRDGRVIVHGVAIKPGKPTLIGTAGQTVIFGLPGHPASALLAFHVFLRYMLQRMMRMPDHEVYLSAQLDQDVHPVPGKTTYQMVRLRRKDSGWTAVPLRAKSGMMSLLAKASGYIIVDQDRKKVPKGQEVQVFLFQMEF